MCIRDRGGDIGYLGLQPVIDKLDLGLDTPMSLLQQIWSKGMLQRVDLSRAIHANSVLYLLDESCCHIAIDDECLFYQLLREHVPKAILVIASHRLVKQQNSLSGAIQIYLD